MERLMSDRLKGSAHKTYASLPNATSSLASEDGAMPSGSPDGLTNEKSGQAQAPVFPTAAPLGDATLPWTSGRRLESLSLQAALAWCLANRLPQRELGSMASAMTWKPWITPSGRQFSRLAVSVSTMRAIGFSLWATPTETANQACPSMMKWIGCRGISVNPQAWCRRMGFPVAWLECADLVMPSFRKSRKSSSKAT